MAVTEILGTDSLSSSRITLNDNFSSIEDEITSLKGYLDTTAGTLSGVTISTSQITIDGGTSIDASSATIGVTTTFNGAININNALIKNSVSGSVSSPLTALPASFVFSTYFIDPASSLALSASSIDGNEITLISTGSGTVTGTFGGGNTLTFAGANETTTLRSFNSVWYIINSYGVVVS